MIRERDSTSFEGSEISPDEERTEQIGARLARCLGPGDIVLLEGELGAGKTVLVRGLARGLGHDPGQVVSPSFVLAIWHRGGRLPLLHVDLYRLPDGASLDELGIEDALAAGAVVVVEWGERAPEFLSRGAWRVRVEAVRGDGPRTVTVTRPRSARNYSSR